MSRRFALPLFALFFLPLAAPARELPLRPETLFDWHPDPALVSMFRGPSRFDVKMGAVEQLGEVVIVEGDDSILSDDGSGGLGVVYDQAIQNPVDLANRFYTAYPDEFDELIFFTNFTDNGSPQALAYEIQTQNDILGLGEMIFDDSAKWGSKTSRLHAFVNMKAIDQYERFDGLSIADPRSGLYPTMAQEYGHRWLAFMKYKDRNNNNSAGMLGRDMAHWASTLQSDASVFDGIRWKDNGDGTFTAVEGNKRFSPLDLYAMGLLPASDVPPFFLIQGAVKLWNGQKVNPAGGIGINTPVKGTREDITINQVIAASGPRTPAFDVSQKSFRVAFVLVTRPGERAGEVVDNAERLEIVRKNWEEAYQAYSGGRGEMCTQVSAPCGSPAARVTGGTLTEAGGNGNGVIEPGEPVDVTFDLKNDGVGTATDVRVTATSPSVMLPTTPTVVASIGNGQQARVTIRGTVAADGALCGKPLTVQAASTTQGHTWRGFAQTIPGTYDLRYDRFDSGAGFWGANLDGKDTATVDAFEWGQPQRYGYGSYFTFQPSAGHGTDGGAWFTGIARGNLFTGATHSLPKGRSTIWSPWMNLSAAVHPRLRYFAWLVALDYTIPNQAPTTADMDHLILEASNDGTRFTKVDQVDGADDRWRQRDVDLEELVKNGQLALDQPVLFRFTVNRENDPESVEAGVDDFQILSDTPACSPTGAPDLGVDPPPPLGGCSIAPRATPGPLLFALIALAALGFRRRNS